jgi:hypothetical protein
VARDVPLPFTVSQQSVAKATYPWRGKRNPRMSRSRELVEKWGITGSEPAGLATLLLPGSTGKLVHIDAKIFELDWTEVSAAIDTNPYFTRDGLGRVGNLKSAWHVARLHHHCRLLGVPEACCERVGSIMKSIWSNNHSASLASIMDMTILSVGGVSCCGSTRDEELCKLVADATLDMGRVPDLRPRARRSRDAKGIIVSRAVDNFRRDANEELEKVGRHATFDVDGSSDSDRPVELGKADVPRSSRPRAAEVAFRGWSLPHKGCPKMQLTPDMQTRLAKVTESGVVSALPVFHRKGGHKPEPPSTARERLAAWCTSKEGKAWKDAKDARIKAALEADDED